jgi:hypothetical protein
MQLERNLMTNTLPPGYRTGKICYLEIPATDISEAADFYHQAFGWSLCRDSDGAVAFDNTVGGVSGMWVRDRPPATEPGLMSSVVRVRNGVPVITDGPYLEAKEFLGG